MRAIVLCGLAAALVLASSPPTTRDTDPMIESIRQGILQGETAVETVRWNAVVTRKRGRETGLPGPELLRRRSEGVGKGLRTRLSVARLVNDVEGLSDTFFWDSQTIVKSSPETNRADIRARNDDDEGPAVRWGFDPRNYGRYVWDIPLSECLLEYPCKYIGREEIKGSTCEVIGIEWADRGRTVKVWVDPAVGFLIRRCEVRDEQGRLRNLQGVEEIASSGDAHLPRKAYRESYGPVPMNGEGEFVSYGTVVMECEAVALNEEVEDSEVVFEPLPGQRIYDTTAAGGPRVTSVPAEDAVLDSLIQEASDAVQEAQSAPAGEPLKAVVPASSAVAAAKGTTQRQRFVGAALIVLAALAACAAFYVKVSKRSTAHRGTE